MASDDPTPTPKSPACEDCRHGRDTSNIDQTQCRRYPTPVIKGRHEVCSEFQPRAHQVLWCHCGLAHGHAEDHATGHSEALKGNTAPQDGKITLPFLSFEVARLVRQECKPFSTVRSLFKVRGKLAGDYAVHEIAATLPFTVTVTLPEGYAGWRLSVLNEMFLRPAVILALADAGLTAHRKHLSDRTDWP